MSISVKVDDSRVQLKLANLPSDIRRRLVETMTKIGYELADDVKTGKLSGQVLNVRSGLLRSSVGNETTDEGGRITTKVGVPGSRVPYAAIHEYGGTINVPEVSGKLMVFGQPPVFTMHHKAYPVKMPERSYLRSTLTEKAPHYISQIADAIKEVVR